MSVPRNLAFFTVDPSADEGSLTGNQNERCHATRPTGHEPVEIAPAPQKIGEMAGERISGLAGCRDHSCIGRRRQVGNRSQPSAEPLGERPCVVMDRAWAAIERVVGPRGRDRDL